MLKLVDVRPSGEGQFTGARKYGGTGRVYGGQVVAQALAAASKTVPPGRLVHSLHAYFLRGGSEGEEIRYRVEADFDGGSFSNRRVIALQQDKVIFNLAASFHIDEPGDHHQAEMPAVPPPEELVSICDMIAAMPDETRNPMMAPLYARPSPFEIRPVGVPPLFAINPMEPRIAFWFRVPLLEATEQWIERVIIAYISDFGLLEAAIRPHGVKDRQVASLDHGLWFHRDIKAREWHLFDMDSPWAGMGRGLAFGRIFDATGHLVASVTQEGLMRVLAGRKGAS